MDDVFTLGVRFIRTSDGTTLEPPPSGVTVVVGGNNVGKSTFLRELYGFLSEDGSRPPSPGLTISSVEPRKTGSSSAAFTWLQERRPFESDNSRSGVKIPNGPVIDALWHGQVWDSSIHGLGLLGGLYVSSGDVHARLAWTHSVAKREDLRDPPTHPLHHLEQTESLLSEVQELSQKIFGQTLTLDRLSGHVKLRVGQPDIPAPTIDAISDEYVSALKGLPPLADQGDGFKSLMGIVLPLITLEHPITIIDEPEAFLHPPQARALGRFLGQKTKELDNNALFVATHDRNFLLGLLDSGAPISVIRLDRLGDVSSVKQLDSEALASLWSDPVLRYSNLLEGLFHRAVVIAEADGDCRFYAAALDGLLNEVESSVSFPYSSDDILFVPANGKDGFPKMASALVAVGVPTVCVCDIDVLSDRAKLQRLVAALGGKWTDAIEKKYRDATANFVRPKTEVRRGAVAKLISAALEPTRDQLYDKEAGELVRAAMRPTRSRWDDAKEHGQSAFTGKSAKASRELLDALELIGLVVVREGELERLAPEVERRKGPEWLREALESNAHLADPARTYIKKVATTIHAAIQPS